jgi:hypothetical protein
MSGPRFDRIVPLITLVLAGLGIVFLLELNTQALVVNPGAGLPSFSVAWALIAALALITGVGVELVARAEPQLHASGWMTTVAFRQRRVELALPLWILPMLTPIAVFAFFRLFKGALATNAYLLVLLATAGLLLTVLIAQHYLIQGPDAPRQRARTVLIVVAYALMFAMFSAVTFNRYRTLYAVALVFPSAALLAADILRGRVHAHWTIAAIVALVTIQCYWAFNYWPVPFWFNSVALLVVFYVLLGVAQSSGQAQDRVDAGRGITRPAMLEYGIVGAVALIALALAAAWLRSRNIDLRSP